jgi:hypothetical protein
MAKKKFTQDIETTQPTTSDEAVLRTVPVTINREIPSAQAQTLREETHTTDEGKLIDVFRTIVRKYYDGNSALALTACKDQLRKRYEII